MTSNLKKVCIEDSTLLTSPYEQGTYLPPKASQSITYSKIGSQYKPRSSVLDLINLWTSRYSKSSSKEPIYPEKKYWKVLSSSEKKKTIGEKSFITLRRTSKEKNALTLKSIENQLQTLIDETNTKLLCLSDDDRKSKDFLIMLEEKYSRACAEYREICTQVKELTSRLAGLDVSKLKLQAALDKLESDMALINQKIKKQQEIRDDAAIDWIPFVGQIAGLVTRRYERMIPFYSSIQGVVSLIEQDKENAERVFSLRQKEKEILVEEIQNVSSKILLANTKKSSCHTNMTELEILKNSTEQKIVKQGQELTAIRNTLFSTKELLSKCNFLKMDFDLGQEISGYLGEPEMDDFLSRIQSIQKSFQLLKIEGK